MGNVAIFWDIAQTLYKYRFECFVTVPINPKLCKLYKRMPTPMVPYRNVGSFSDDGYIDEILTKKRSWDDW